MRADSPFLVELFRTAPLGLVLQLVGFACVATLFWLIDSERPATGMMKLVWGAGFVALAVGMHLTHRESVKLQARRRAKRAERSAAPWDASKGD